MGICLDHGFIKDIECANILFTLLYIYSSLTGSLYSLHSEIRYKGEYLKHKMHIQDMVL